MNSRSVGTGEKIAAEIVGKIAGKTTGRMAAKTTGKTTVAIAVEIAAKAVVTVVNHHRQAMQKSRGKRKIIPQNPAEEEAAHRQSKMIIAAITTIKPRTTTKPTNPEGADLQPVAMGQGIKPMALIPIVLGQERLNPIVTITE